MDHNNRLRELRELIKHKNIHIIGVPEEERGKWAKGLYGEIIAENFLHLEKNRDIQIQETQRTPSKSTIAGQHQHIPQLICKIQ